MSYYCWEGGWLVDDYYWRVSQGQNASDQARWGLRYRYCGWIYHDWSIYRSRSRSEDLCRRGRISGLRIENRVDDSSKRRLW